jgi:DNA-binding transcriptional LysR family regulator
MDLVQIKYFLALSRTLNFTRAADWCHVTQPALSRSIQRLEEEMGGRLILRERDLTQLTELGRRVLPTLQRIADAAEDVGRVASAFHC